MQKSYRAPNPGDKRAWFIIDAKDVPVGRLAVVIANKLRAKDLPTFDPSVDAGAFVIVTNAALVKLTGKKEEQKTYQRYSGYRDGLKEFTAAEMRAKHPDRMIKEAVDDDARQGVRGRGRQGNSRGAEAGRNQALRRI